MGARCRHPKGGCDMVQQRPTERKIYKWSDHAAEISWQLRSFQNADDEHPGKVTNIYNNLGHLQKTAHQKHERSNSCAAFGCVECRDVCKNIWRCVRFASIVCNDL